jgi:transcription antitermination factor NusG
MSYWAVARTLVRRESFAGERLETAGFEIFVPKTSGGPLFPGYLFVRIQDRWRIVDRTLGVLGLIKFGDTPARCPDREIALWRSQMDPLGLVRLPEPPPPPRVLRQGDRVKVGVLPAVYAGMSVRERELVLIELLGRRMAVRVRRAQLAAER